MYEEQATKCVFIVSGSIIIFHFFSFYIFVTIRFTDVVIKESFELFTTR